MKPSLRSSLIVALVLGGCGGNRHVADTPSSAFVGFWSGTYRQGDGSGTGIGHRTGTITMAIARYDASPSGAPGVGLSGTVQDSDRGAGTVGGVIVDQEPMNGIGEGSSMNFQFGNTGETYKGRPKIDSRGHLVGPVYLFLGDISVLTQLDLAPVASSG